VKISILIPTYNEESYILQTLKRVNEQKSKLNLEIVISDDGSTDQTISILNNNKYLFDKLVSNKKNQGKGAALKIGLNNCSGDIIIIQDADLEYNPEEFSDLIDPFLKNEADVVYGSRFLGNKTKRVLYFKNRIANFFLTMLVNLLTNLNFTDVETGYKAFRKDILKDIVLKENSFTFEIEFTMKIAKLKKRIYEVGISYNGRTVEEGKKIKVKDGFLALYSIFKYRFFN
jgi:glycosyltransferase involved in cell wall biosynthesis|tara:strand:- start:801 stop:1490 length:690 start_codon:yes stop_codon:yes gene_type:complete